MKFCQAIGCEQKTVQSNPFCRLHYFMLPKEKRYSLRKPFGLTDAVDAIRELENNVNIIYSCVL